MLKKLSLTNFKSFKNMDDLELKALTIIVGKNSCGKSSILQSLLLLKQTLESQDTSPLNLDGQFLKHTNIKELAHGLPPVNQAEIAYKLEVDSENVSGEIEIKFKNKKNEASYEAVVDTYSHKLSKLSPRFKESQKLKTDFDSNNTKVAYVKKHMEDYLSGLIKEGSKIVKVEQCFTNFFPTDIKVTIQNIETSTLNELALPMFLLNGHNFESVRHQVEMDIKNIQYLSPVRAIPERAYVHYSDYGKKLKVDGSNAAHILWSQQNTKVQWNGENVLLKDAVNSCIKCLGLSQYISPEKIGDLLYKVSITENSSGGNVSLADVGFGYSQILPIILLGLLNGKDNLMLLEQPEIHLHPSSAANLADLFLNFASDNKRFLIETHSQELINRLRLRVIENPELKDKINIVFVDSNSDNGALIKQFPIDENGMFPEWPDGFLDESKKIADAIINARLAKADDEW